MLPSPCNKILQQLNTAANYTNKSFLYFKHEWSDFMYLFPQDDSMQLRGIRGAENHMSLMEGEQLVSSL